jgi:hypothetical protein
MLEEVSGSCGGRGGVGKVGLVRRCLKAGMVEEVPEGWDGRGGA